MNSSSLAAWLRMPVDGSSLALFRILTGLVALFALAGDWWRIGFEFVNTEFHFTYPGFEWLTPWPNPWMYWHYGALAAAAVLLILGLAYRLAVALLVLGFGYLFLLDEARYSNSSYLLLLTLFMLFWVPANRVWSIDARRVRAVGGGSVPRWALLSVGALVSVPLLYMGLSRLNADWLAGYPFRLWFRTAAHGHFLGPRLSELLLDERAPRVWGYFALLVHLAVVPMLLWRRTRLVALALFVSYYLGTSLIFGRLIFPFLLAVGLGIFFAPDWPRRFAAVISRRPFQAGPAAGVAASPARDEKLSLAVLSALLVFHLLFPARSLLYPGKAAWTGDGYRFAWREMLDDKSCETLYSVLDPATGKTWEVDPKSRLAGFQARELNVRPDMIPQFADYLALSWKYENKVENAQVFATKAKCSLNTRPYSQLLDPKLDLTQVETGPGATDWILPMDLKMPPGWRGIVTPP